MKVGEICSRNVFAVEPGEPLASVAGEMHTRNIGCAVIIRRDAVARVPVGIVTDRDILRGQFDRKADLFCLSVEDVMTQHPLVIHEDCDLADAIELMGARAVRRAPVVDKRGSLVGIVSFDDLLPVLAGEMTTIARLISAQVSQARMPAA
jgi:CBS domain-containing protein